MKKVGNKNSVTASYDLLVEKILDLSLKPGEVVTEFSLSERFGMGRTPIREALKKLEVEGLIQTRKRTKVIQMLQNKDVEEIFDIKILLESNMARIAAIRGTARQRQKMGQVIQSMKDYKQSLLTNRTYNDDYLQEWLNLDQSFHAILFEMADNDRVQRIIRNLNLQWHRFRVGLMAIEDRIERAVDEHYVIGMAIINNEPEEAERTMHDHLFNLKRVLTTLMKAFASV